MLRSYEPRTVCGWSGSEGDITPRAMRHEGQPTSSDEGASRRRPEREDLKIAGRRADGLDRSTRVEPGQAMERVRRTRTPILLGR